MSRSDYRILIVEDEAVAAMLLETLLGGFGFSAFLHASTGARAIELSRRERPRIVFMDIGLPGGMDGIEASRAIMEEPGIALVFATAYGDEATIARAEALKPLGYLVKPVTPRKLESIVRAFPGLEGA